MGTVKFNRQTWENIDIVKLRDDYLTLISEQGEVIKISLPVGTMYQGKNRVQIKSSKSRVERLFVEGNALVEGTIHELSSYTTGYVLGNITGEVYGSLKYDNGCLVKSMLREVKANLKSSKPDEFKRKIVHLEGNFTFVLCKYNKLCEVYLKNSDIYEASVHGCVVVNGTVARCTRVGNLYYCQKVKK